MKNIINKYQIPTTGWNHVWSYLMHMDNGAMFLPTFSKTEKRERRHFRDCKYCDQARNIMYGSIGRNADETFNKIRAILKCSRGPETFIRDYVEKLRIVDGKKYLIDDYGRMRLFNHGRMRFRSAFYVEDGVLKYIPYTNGHRKKSSWREVYIQRTWRRKSRKTRIENNRRKGDILLHMINKPDLFRFFTGIEKEYLELSKIEEASYAPKPERNPRISQKQYDWSLMRWDWDRRKFTPEKRNRIRALRYYLDRLREKDVNVYYESKAYIYSLQKECHHF